MTSSVITECLKYSDSSGCYIGFRYIPRQRIYWIHRFSHIGNSVLSDGSDGRTSEDWIVSFCGREVIRESESYSGINIHFDYVVLFL